MTKAMYNKFIEAVNDFHNRFPCRYVNNWNFKYYGKVYRIEENIERFKIFRVNPNSIHDTLIGVIHK